MPDDVPNIASCFDAEADCESLLAQLAGHSQNYEYACEQAAMPWCFVERGTEMFCLPHEDQCEAAIAPQQCIRQWPSGSKVTAAAP